MSPVSEKLSRNTAPSSKLMNVRKADLETACLNHLASDTTPPDESRLQSSLVSLVPSISPSFVPDLWKFLHKLSAEPVKPPNDSHSRNPPLELSRENRNETSHKNASSALNNSSSEPETNEGKGGKHKEITPLQPMEAHHRRKHADYNQCANEGESNDLVTSQSSKKQKAPCDASNELDIKHHSPTTQPIVKTRREASPKPLSPQATESDKPRMGTSSPSNKQGSKNVSPSPVGSGGEEKKNPVDTGPKELASQSEDEARKISDSGDEERALRRERRRRRRREREREEERRAERRERRRRDRYDSDDGRGERRRSRKRHRSRSRSRSKSPARDSRARRKRRRSRSRSPETPSEERAYQIRKEERRRRHRSRSHSPRSPSPERAFQSRKEDRRKRHVSRSLSPRTSSEERDRHTRNDERRKRRGRSRTRSRSRSHSPQSSSAERNYRRREERRRHRQSRSRSPRSLSEERLYLRKKEERRQRRRERRRERERLREEEDFDRRRRRRHRERDRSRSADSDERKLRRSPSPVREQLSRERNLNSSSRRGRDDVLGEDNGTGRVVSESQRVSQVRKIDGDHDLHFSRAAHALAPADTPSVPVSHANMLQEPELQTAREFSNLERNQVRDDKTMKLHTEDLTHGMVRGINSGFEDNFPQSSGYGFWRGPGKNARHIGGRGINRVNVAGNNNEAEDMFVSDERVRLDPRAIVRGPGRGLSLGRNRGRGQGRGRGRGRGGTRNGSVGHDGFQVGRDVSMKSNRDVELREVGIQEPGSSGNIRSAITKVGRDSDGRSSSQKPLSVLDRLGKTPSRAASDGQFGVKGNISSAKANIANSERSNSGAKTSQDSKAEILKMKRDRLRAKVLASLKKGGDDGDENGERRT